MSRLFATSRFLPGVLSVAVLSLPLYRAVPPWEGAVLAVGALEARSATPEETRLLSGLEIADPPVFGLFTTQMGYVPGGTVALIWTGDQTPRSIQVFESISIDGQETLVAEFSFSPMMLISGLKTGGEFYTFRALDGSKRELGHGVQQTIAEPPFGYEERGKQSEFVCQTKSDTDDCDSVVCGGSEGPPPDLWRVLDPDLGAASFSAFGDGDGCLRSLLGNPDLFLDFTFSGSIPVSGPGNQEIEFVGFMKRETASGNGWEPYGSLAGSYLGTGRVRSCEIECIAGGRFRRADANGDGAVNIGDPIWTLEFLFRSGRAPVCMDAADANDDGSIDISDPILTLVSLFGGSPGFTIPPPGTKSCGDDPTQDGVSCDEYTRC